MNDTAQDTTKTTDPHGPAARRVWLRDNGFIVGDRGRISAAHNKAYDEAHGL